MYTHLFGSFFTFYSTHLQCVFEMFDTAIQVECNRFGVNPIQLERDALDSDINFDSLTFFEGDRSSPSSARRRGTDFTQMDAGLWFTQAKADLDAANNDMHPITGKPAYEWVCYKCYRVSAF